MNGRFACLAAALALAALAAPAWGGSSRFMILITEKNMGAYSMDDAAQVFAQRLLASGAEVIDAELVKTSVTRDKALQVSAGEPRAAAALGLSFGADIIVVGKAVAKGSAERIRDTGFRSYSATVSLRAIRTDTAEVVASESASATKIHVDDLAGGSEAIRLAAEELGGRMIPPLLAASGKGPAGATREVALIVGGVEQVWQVAAIKQTLRENVRGVSDVSQRSFTAGVVAFDVMWSGDSQKLAEELTLAKPAYFRLRVLSVTPNKIDAQFVRME